MLGFPCSVGDRNDGGLGMAAAAIMSHAPVHWSIRPRTAASRIRPVPPMIRWRKMTCLLLASALLAASLPACRRTPDEVQIREAIAAIEQAAENGAASDVGASLSEDFEIGRASCRESV